MTAERLSLLEPPGQSKETGFDVAALRAQFPILSSSAHGRPLVYLDSAATTQKPRSVIDAMSDFLLHDNASVHRGVHYLSERSTEAYEGAREKVRSFLNAEHSKEIVFTRGTTESINLVARSFGSRLGPGDQVLITEMEHHSNIVPWQMICAERGAVLKVAPVDERGELDLEALEGLIGEHTRLVAHVSNVLGTLNPIAEIVARSHAEGVPVLVDGAQGAPHLLSDVRALGCDFYALSAHKMYGPTGIGVLYGRRELLEAMPPYQGGGDMVLSVSFSSTRYNDVPHRFEAGTQNVLGAVGLAAAIDFLRGLPRDALQAHEADVLRHAVSSLSGVEGVRVVGAPAERRGVVSFVTDGVHAHDVGTVLDREGIAVRTGHHCAQPLLARLGLPATARASFGCYSTRDEVDALVAGLRSVKEIFS